MYNIEIKNNDANTNVNKPFFFSLMIVVHLNVEIHYEDFYWCVIILTYSFLNRARR